MKYINKLERAALKIKTKHLAAEARIIRQEEVKWKGNDKLYFKNHRKTTVRNEARATQLAIAFMRGVPYKVMERKCENVWLRNYPIAKRMASMIVKYSNKNLVIPEPPMEPGVNWKERAEKRDKDKKEYVLKLVHEWFNQA
jgi:hypothetical protein